MNFRETFEKFLPKRPIHLGPYGSHIIIMICLVIAISAVYLQTIRHDFVNYDDNAYVTENRQVRPGWSVEGIQWSLTARVHRHWHPLTWLSHMTDCQLFGLNPAGHHLMNIFFHIINTLLLFLILRHTTGDLIRPTVVAALFALHPLHVETVAWISDRKDLLGAFFWLLTIWAYVHYSERPRILKYILVFFLFILGLMAKSIVVTLPAVLLLMDYWPLGRFQDFLSGRKADSRKGHISSGPEFKYKPALYLIGEKLLFFIFIGISALITISIVQLGGRETIDLTQILPTMDSISRSGFSYISYMGKMIWPTHLSAYYPTPVIIPAWKAIGAGILLISITICVVLLRKSKPYLMFGWFWYLITLAPVARVLNIGPIYIADRYTYIPLVGLFIMIAWGVPDLLKQWRHRRTALAILASIVLLTLMTVSWFQVRYWKDSFTLFRHAVNVTHGNHVAHYNLGLAFTEEGKLDKAIHHFSAAIRIKPNYAKAYNNLGNSFTKKGDFQKAIQYYSKALQIEPGNAEIYNNVGVALELQGNLDKAIRFFSEALRIDPDLARVHNNLGDVLRRKGDITKAAHHFSEAIRIKPDYAEAHHNLGQTLMQQGDLPKAISHYAEALRIDPDNAEVHNNFGIALARQGRLKEAVAHFFKALQIKPDYAQARHNLEFVLRLLSGSEGNSKQGHEQ